MELYPGHAEANFGLAKCLAGSGRTGEAAQLLDAFAAKYPNKRAEAQKVRGTITFSVAPSQPAR